jgi:hypothetical protein
MPLVNEAELDLALIEGPPGGAPVEFLTPKFLALDMFYCLFELLAYFTVN